MNDDAIAALAPRTPTARTLNTMARVTMARASALAPFMAASSMLPDAAGNVRRFPGRIGTLGRWRCVVMALRGCRLRYRPAARNGKELRHLIECVMPELSA